MYLKIGRVLFVVVLVFAIIFNFNSCKKYEEGPSLSLLTKTSRLTGKWEVQKIDNVNIIDGNNMTFEFKKDSIFSFESSIDGQSSSYDGTWFWSGDKSSIGISGIDFFMEWNITKLSNKDFWFVNDANTVKFECVKE